MKKSTVIFLFLVLSLIILKTLVVYAYDNVVVHQKINTNAVMQSNIGNVLIQLNYPLGIKTKFKDNDNVEKEVWEWLEDGAKEEDIPLVRSYNHFHDPTKSWDKAGLDDYVLGILHVTGDSSVLWAQNPDQKYIASDGTVYDVNGTWSWPKARDYYYQALISTDKTLREQNFANTFRALGQIMHLLADSAVPEHVRNEEHAFGWHYEKWCEQNSSTLNTSATAIDYSITNNSLVSGLVPITNFWDTMPSLGYNLNPIGLSEYTNFNFFGRDTILKNYTYPQKSDTVILNINAEDNKSDERVYLKGTTSDGQSINHLVSTGYLWAELTTTDPEGLDDSRFSLDDECFKDYASILVPKAVGYSAGLLDYFFRGKIDFVADSNTPGSYVIENLGTENMDGVFSLYYDAVDGARQTVPNASWNIQVAGNGQSVPLTFIPPTNPAPKIPGEYMLVFNGNMGQEQAAGGSRGAVVGKHITCTLKTDIADYQPPLFGGNRSYERLPVAWLTHATDGNFTLNGYLWILKNPIPPPEWRCFWFWGCYWYPYYPASPYANNYDPSGDRYTPQLSSSNEFVKAWIDLNGDKIFTDDELVYEGQFSPFLVGLTWYTNQLITIQEPLTISPKGYCQAVMRVALRWGAPPSGPYDTWDYGDVQDFQIELK